MYTPVNDASNAGKDVATSIEDLNNAFTLRAIEDGFVLTPVDGIAGNLKVYDLCWSNDISRGFSKQGVRKNNNPI